MTNLIMVGIVLFLAGLVTVGGKYSPEGAHLFDRENSGAMRGFWSLIVVLVHVPLAYQNRIQDLLGSFAYVGVTFFFMTSAYGLRLAAVKHPVSIDRFWTNRLPKLLVPCLLTNVIAMALRALCGDNVDLSMLVWINGWVWWLLVCYLIFWLCYRFLPDLWRDWMVCGLVAAFSLAVYRLQPETTTWCPEVLGFAWGILLGRWMDRFRIWLRRGWLLKSIGLCLLSAGLGVAYLRCKGIPFWGDYVLKILLGMGILGFVLALNGRISIGNPVSRTLGAISYEVYLLHGSVLLALKSSFPELDSGVFILAGLLCTVLLSLAARRLGGRILSPFYKKQQMLQR